MKKILVVGGTSGLGLSLAQILSKTDTVYVAGKHDPKEPAISYMQFEITSNVRELEMMIDNLISDIGKIDTVFYSVGFNQVSALENISYEDIVKMVNACLIGGIELVRKILIKQGVLDELVLITSTSASIPREYEPVYSSAKAGLAHFGRSVGLSSKINKILIVAPSGMKTKMQTERGNYDPTLLEPDWVANEILDQLSKTMKFREVSILRNPPRIEVRD